MGLGGNIGSRELEVWKQACPTLGHLPSDHCWGLGPGPRPPGRKSQGPQQRDASEPRPNLPREQWLNCVISY